MKPILHALAGVGLLTSVPARAAVSEQDVVAQYANVAHAVFADALQSAKTLQGSVDALLAAPSDANLQKARTAWKAARVPYQQGEVFRFGNTNVDEWEGQLNAWPLDEGLIDYVVTGKYHHELGNVGANANIIANTSLKLGSDTLDLANITPELLARSEEHTSELQSQSNLACRLLLE